MKNKRVRLIGLLVTLTTLLALIIPAAPAMADAGVNLVILPPVQSIGVSNNFTVTVQAQAGTLTVSGIEIHLDYDTNYLSILSATSGTALPTVLQKTFKIPGTFDFAAGLDVSLDPLEPASGTFTLVSITFNATQPTPSPTQVIFHTITGSGDTRTTSVVSGETNITGTLTGGSYTIFGPANKLGFTTQPVGAAAGSALSTQPIVAIQDALGNTVVTDSTTQVTLAVTGNAAPMTGTKTVTAVNGLATFSGLSMNLTGTYTLTASSNPALTTKISNSFNITPGSASKLVFTTQPGGVAAGNNLSPQPVVAIEDAFSNVVNTDSTTAITLAITGTPAGVTLSGSKTVTAASGNAVFSGLSINKIGTYTLTATSNTSLTQSVSTSFSITFGPASQLVFTTQPGGAVAGSPLAPQPVVAIEDSLSNVITNDNTTRVSLALSGNTTPVTFGGVTTVTAINGLATFSGLSVSQTGLGYILTATSNTSLTPATSNPFNIAAGPAVKMVFTTQPGGVAAGNPLSPQPVVMIEDAQGNPALNDNTTVVTLTISGSNPALLSGTKAATAVNGVATFSGLSVNQTGAYTLSTTSNNAALQNATSTSFSITAGPASKLVFTTQPGGAQAGAPLNPQPAVAIQDAFSNTVTSDSATAMTLTLSGNNPSLLSGTKTLTFSSGVATFSGLSVNQTGTYFITANTGLGPNIVPTVTAAISNNFTIIPGPASKLVFATQPGGAAAGNAFNPQPVVAVQDSFSNVITADNVTNVTLTATNVSTNATATITGTTTVKVTNGVATFSGLNIRQLGNFTLTATSFPAYASATSNQFSVVVGPPSKLAFTTQPVGAAAGATLGAQPVVQIQDALGFLVTSDNGTMVTLIISGNNPPSLNGVTAVADVNGVATFSGLSLNQTGTYTLTATSNPAYTPATSSSFTISPGQAVKLVFTAQPVGATAGKSLTTQPVVAVEDNFSNIVTTDSTTSITLALSGNTTAALSGTKTLTSINGVVIFSGLSVNQTGSYSLITTSNNTALQNTTSNTFFINGPASKLGFTTQPTGTTAGTSFTPPPAVAVQDAQGNTVQDDPGTSVTLALTGNTSATLAGTKTVTASKGVATFSGLSMNLTGTYSLTASSSPVYTAAISNNFTITPGPATKLVFTTQPGNAVAGNPTIQAAIAIRDAFGNLEINDNSTGVTLSITGNPAGAVLSGNSSATAVNGVATFSGLSINKSGTYTLTASTTSLTATSTSFVIAVGPPSQLGFTTQPGGATAGNPLTSQPIVAVQDNQGNTVTTDNTTSITLAISGNNTSILSGTKTKTAINGLATFSGLSVNQTGSYTLTTTSNNTALQNTTSNSFIINGPASLLAFTSAPFNTVAAGVLLNPQPVVSVQDSSGNNVQDDNTTRVTLVATNVSTNATTPITGTTVVQVSKGVASFSGLIINQIGTFTLTASSNTSLPPVISNSFVVRQGVNLSLSPAAQNVLLGNTFTVAIQAQSGNLTTDSIGVFLDFDPSSLKIVSAVPTNAFLVFTNDFSSPGGYAFTGSGDTNNGPPTGNYTVVTLTFQALKVTTNSTAVSFSSGGEGGTFTRSGESTTTGTLTPANVTIVGGEIIINSNLVGNPLNITGATFTVSPNPYSSIPTSGTLTVADNAANDNNSAFGTIDLKNVPTGTYTVKQTVAPSGFNPDPTSQIASVTSTTQLTLNFSNTSQSSGYSGGGGNAGIIPTVVSVTPANVATTVGINSPLTATFSVSMFALDLTTSTFTLMRGTTPVAGSVSYDSATNKVTFTPTAPLTYSTLYTATIASSVRSSQGVAMGVNYVWTFTTAAAPPPVTTTPVATTPVATTPAATKPIATTPAATVPVVTGPPTTTPGAPPTTTTRPATTTSAAPVPTTTPATTVATTTPASTSGTSIWWVAVIILIIIIIAVLLLIMLLTRRKKSDDKK